MTPVIAITMGDAAGIGPEIIVKALAHPEVYEECCPIVIGDAARLRLAQAITAAPVKIHSIAPEAVSQSGLQPGTVDCIDLHLIPEDLRWGKISPIAGDAAFRYLEFAAQLAMQGSVQAICTAPLNKEALHAGGHYFPGHTELLASLTNAGEVSMMLSTRARPPQCAASCRAIENQKLRTSSGRGNACTKVHVTWRSSRASCRVRSRSRARSVPM